MTTEGAAPHVFGSATVHALLFCFAATAPRPLSAAAADQAEAMRPYLIALEERSRAGDRVLVDGVGERQSSGVNDSEGNGVAGGGQKHDEPQGAMGATLSREKEHRRWSAPRKAASKETWDGATSAAADFGIIGLLGHRGSVPVSAVGERALSKSPDPLMAQGAMWAPALGASLGHEAAGLSGTGIGGGGAGDGVGLGTVGDLGHTDGAPGLGTGGNGSPAVSLGMVGGWGSDGWEGHAWRGTWSGHYRSSYVCGDSVSISGRLPPEAIQRVVRDNFGRFRLCYENGLVHNPSLAGRVSTKFVIGSNGEVSSSANDGSDLPDASVVACITQAFSTLAFPKPPAASSITVVYPISFASEAPESKRYVF